MFLTAALPSTVSYENGSEAGAQSSISSDHGLSAEMIISPLLLVYVNSSCVFVPALQLRPLCSCRGRRYLERTEETIPKATFPKGNTSNYYLGHGE